MSRILALDYGTKRVGIAVTDPLQMIANSLETVETKNLLSYLENYIAKENVVCIVIGLAMRLHNVHSEIEREIVRFIVTLKKKFPTIKIDRQDERFTSKMAYKTIIESGIGKEKRKDKTLVDKISATIILQSYLERIKQ